MMALKLKQWAGRYALVWFALVLIVAGLVAGAFGPRTQPVAAIVTLVGALALAVWLARQPLWNRRSLEAGGNVLIKTLALVVILAAVNFLAVQSGLRLDLTSAQRFSLAPESKKLVQNLQQPVEVLIFDKQINAEARQLLELYQRENPKFQFRVVDPQSDPATAQKYEVRGFGEVHLESQGRQERLREALSESSLSNALVRLTQPSQGKVVYVQGHGERPAEPGQRGYSQAIQALEGRNFTHQPQVLAETPNLPQDTKVVVVAGPQRPWLAAEAKILRTFFDQGGGILLLIDPQTESGLEPFLSNLGIKLDGRVVVSQIGPALGLGPAVAVANNYGDHPITRDFGKGITFFPLAQAVDLVGEAEQEGVPLLLTGPGVWAESRLDREPFFDPGEDRSGPLNLGVALTKGKGRLVVIGDSEFAADGLFNQQLNGDLFLNAVGWLAGADASTLSIRPKEAANRRLNLTQAQGNILALAALLVVPVGGFAMAGILWWRRR